MFPQPTKVAVDWWIAYLTAHTDLEDTTWKEFKAVFCNHYVPLERSS